MVLSKPLMKALGFYFEQSYNHPIRTKAISCCLIASAGNYASQCISGSKAINQQSLLAYAAFGLLFGGTIPHYFYELLERWVPDEVSFAVTKRLLLERLFYTPLYQAFTLYMLARLEGKDHKTAMRQLGHLYWSVLTSSWKFLTVVQLLNFSLVPPMLRVLVVNLIGFFWCIYIANKRRQEEAKALKPKPKAK